MKKIYWIINQFNNNDAAISCVEIANKLVQYRGISLIVLKKLDNSINYNVSGKIDVISLNIEDKYIVDDKLNSYFKKNKKILMDKISELTTKNDLLISSSFLSSYIVPKGRRFLYYYTGTKNDFLSFKNKLLRNKHRTPDNYIFTSELLKKAVEKKKRYFGAYQIYPSATSYQYLDLTSKNNTISFIGSFDNYNNPLKALEVIKKIKESGLKFTFNMYGSGILEDKIKAYIKENSLINNVNLISDYELVDAIRKSDLIINTNNNDALPLIIIEALTQSVPVLSYKNELTDDSHSIIIDSENYILEIKELFTKTKRLEKFKQNALNYSYRFSKNVIIAKWLDILEIEDNLGAKE